MVGGGREGSGGDSVVGMECVRVGVCESGDDRVDGGVVDEERWIGGAWGGGGGRLLSSLAQTPVDVD